MKELKSTTLFLWVVVLGTLISVLVMGINNSRTYNNIDDSKKDSLSYYERFKEELSEKFEIIDTTEVCAEALEEIYRDDKFIYYLPCIKSKNITIKMSNGTKYPLRVALDNNIVTINELKTVGLGMYIEPIDKNKTNLTIIVMDK